MLMGGDLELGQLSADKGQVAYFLVTPLLISSAC